MINVKILADSIYRGKRITTFELEYPRFIHAEFMTHRMFSRNAGSSRAITIDSNIEQVENNLAMPIEWGINQKGMQANKIMNGYNSVKAVNSWKYAAALAVDSAKELQYLNLHKQIVNRVLEPFLNIKVVVTATEWNNWYFLRDHEHAQPEIKELASKMWKAKNESTPMSLEVGEWHLPYIEYSNEFGAYYSGELEVDLLDAIKISASCCAQVSYRTLDHSITKAIAIYDRLVTSTPVHASPFEHQATPIDTWYTDWPEGVTHMDRDGSLWSGNFCEWLQYRQLINNHVVLG